MLTKKGIYFFNDKKASEVDRSKKWVHPCDPLIFGHISYNVKFLGACAIDFNGDTDSALDALRKLYMLDGSKIGALPHLDLQISLDRIRIVLPEAVSVLSKDSHFPFNKIYPLLDAAQINILHSAGGRLSSLLSTMESFGLYNPPVHTSENGVKPARSKSSMHRADGLSENSLLLYDLPLSNVAYCTDEKLLTSAYLRHSRRTGNHVNLPPIREGTFIFVAFTRSPRRFAASHSKVPPTNVTQPQSPLTSSTHQSEIVYQCFAFISKSCGVEISNTIGQAFHCAHFLSQRQTKSIEEKIKTKKTDSAEEIMRLKSRVAELEEQVASLKLNSLEQTTSGDSAVHLKSTSVSLSDDPKAPLSPVGCARAILSPQLVAVRSIQSKAVRMDSLPAIDPPPSSVRMRRAITLDSSYAPSVVDTLLFSDSAAGGPATREQLQKAEEQREKGYKSISCCVTPSKSALRDSSVAPGSPSMSADCDRRQQFVILNGAFARGRDLMDFCARGQSIIDPVLLSSPPPTPKRMDDEKPLRSLLNTFDPLCSSSRPESPASASGKCTD